MPDRLEEIKNKINKQQQQQKKNIFKFRTWVVINSKLDNIMIIK